MENNELRGILVNCIYSKKNNMSYVSILLDQEQTSYSKGLEIFRQSFEGSSLFNRLRQDDFYSEVILNYEYRRASFGRDMKMYVTDICSAATGESLLK